MSSAGRTLPPWPPSTPIISLHSKEPQHDDATDTTEVQPQRREPGIARAGGARIDPVGTVPRTEETLAGAVGETRTRKYPPKVSFYLDAADQARLRAAYRHTLAHSSDRSLTDFLGRVVMAEVRRLEDAYNGGQAFPSVAAGQLPQGRPLE